MNKIITMTIAASAIAAAGFAADAETNLQNAAQAAGSAATEKGAEMNAGANVSADQMKANAEGAAAASSTTVTGAIKHRAKQASAKVKAAGSKVSEKYHGAMATHDENKAAADVSATMSTGK